MKTTALFAVLAAAVSASPLAERQTSFLTECTTACAAFLPMYDTCKNVGTSALVACLQPVCEADMYVDLGGCLTCWSVYTGKDSAPYSAFFAKICA